MLEKGLKQIKKKERSSSNNALNEVISNCYRPFFFSVSHNNQSFRSTKHIKMPSTKLVNIGKQNCQKVEVKIEISVYFLFFFLSQYFLEHLMSSFSS